MVLRGIAALFAAIAIAIRLPKWRTDSFRCDSDLDAGIVNGSQFAVSSVPPNSVDTIVLSWAKYIHVERVPLVEIALTLLCRE